MKVLNQIFAWSKLEQLHWNNADLHHLMTWPTRHSLGKHHATPLYPQECWWALVETSHMYSLQKAREAGLETAPAL